MFGLNAFCALFRSACAFARVLTDSVTASFAVARFNSVNAFLDASIPSTKSRVFLTDSSTRLDHSTKPPIARAITPAGPPNSAIADFKPIVARAIPLSATADATALTLVAVNATPVVATAAPNAAQTTAPILTAANVVITGSIAGAIV